MEARFFFVKSFWLGMLPFVDRSRAVCTISRGEPGEGGEFDRVVVEERFMEKRRELLAGR